MPRLPRSSVRGRSGLRDRPGGPPDRRPRSPHPRTAVRCGRGGSSGETHVPAQRPQACQEARLPQPHVDPRRPRRDPRAPVEGPPQAVGLIWRIRDRRTFGALRREGIRARYGPIGITFLPDPARGRSGGPSAGDRGGRRPGAYPRNRSPPAPARIRHRTARGPCCRTQPVATAPPGDLRGSGPPGPRPPATRRLSRRLPGRRRRVDP